VGRKTEVDNFALLFRQNKSNRFSKIIWIIPLHVPSRLLSPHSLSMSSQKIKLTKSKRGALIVSQGGMASLPVGGSDHSAPTASLLGTILCSGRLVVVTPDSAYNGKHTGFRLE
jgi:hypothetical protein